MTKKALCTLSKGQGGAMELNRVIVAISAIRVL